MSETKLSKSNGISSTVPTEIDQYYQRWLKPYAWTTRSLLATTTYSLIQRVSIGNIRSFCLLYGYPRSGGSLLGSLIDAHPGAVIANEYNALGRFTANFQLPRRIYLYDILRNADKQRRKGRHGYKAGGGTYSYEAPALLQQKTRDISVIGVAKAGVTTHNLHRHPDRLNRLMHCYQLPVIGLCIVRNPFDLLSSLHTSAVARSQGIQVEGTINRSFLEFLQERSDILNWFSQVESIQRSNLVNRQQTIYLEDLIKDPAPVLGKIFESLQLEPIDEVVEIISSMVWSEPHKSSENKRWDKDAIEAIKNIIDQNSHLNRYIDDVPQS